MLKVSKNMDTITEERKTEIPAGQERAKSTLCFFFQVQIAKITL